MVEGDAVNAFGTLIEGFITAVSLDQSGEIFQGKALCQCGVAAYRVIGFDAYVIFVLKESLVESGMAAVAGDAQIVDVSDLDGIVHNHSKQSQNYRKRPFELMPTVGQHRDLA